MKILFTSDLHGYIDSFEKFAKILADKDFDCGIIAGDLLDEGIPPKELQEIFKTTDLSEDDFLEELPAAEDTFEESMSKSIQKLYEYDSSYMKSLRYKEEKIKAILNKANKPVFIIPGNHDRVEWSNSMNVINVNQKRVNFNSYNLVGYRWTKEEKNKKDFNKDIKNLKKIVDKKTIFISHESPFIYYNNKLSIKNKLLAKLILQKKPLYCLSGHRHSSFGIYTNNIINGAYPKSRKFISIDTNNKTEFIDTVDSVS